MAYITADTAEILQAKIDSYVLKPNGIPGLVCSIVNREGASVFEHASGLRGIGSHEPMDVDTVFWIASCTKTITAIAAMQLVEQNRLTLDDEDQTEDLLPELKHVMVLEELPNGKMILVEKRRKITLRMLLSHTAGFGYSFSNTKLKKWFDPIGIMEDASIEQDIFGHPLVNQPGEKWEYGVNMDWVGRLIERVSGLSLDEYFRNFIFYPLGMSNTSFFPSFQMKKKLAFLHQRSPNGMIGLRENGHLLHRPLMALTAEEMRTTVNSGGAGLFSVVSEYCEIIATLLNYGTHPRTGWQLLKEQTMREMFRNQIPQFPDFGRNMSPACKPSLVNPASEMYPQSHDQAQGWGLSFFLLLHPGNTGRSAGTVWWTGLANLIWWADLENGVGGMMASQILPFGDKDVFDCLAEVETELYSAIQYNTML